MPFLDKDQVHYKNITDSKILRQIYRIYCEKLACSKPCDEIIQDFSHIYDINNNNMYSITVRPNDNDGKIIVSHMGEGPE